jgi:hypothetical protein
MAWSRFDQRLRPAPQRTSAPGGAASPEKRVQWSRSRLLGIAGYIVHAFGFLALAAAVLLRLGQEAWVVSLIIVAVSLLSLHEAWSGLDRHCRTENPKGD